MHLLDLLAPKSPDPRPPSDTRLAGPRVVLRMGVPADWKDWRALRGLSRDFLKPWEPEWPKDALSRTFFDGMLRRHLREWREGTGYGFFIFMRDGKTLIGGIGLNDVRRGIAQKATLGYWIGEPYAKQGYMNEAAGLVCDFAFRALKLNRVEAGCLPANEPSKRLLKRLGFNEEGYAKSYLRIDGEWQDHMLWGKVTAS
jgi:ribosomal-protein-alanine N-acetyltransferase